MDRDGASAKGERMSDVPCNGCRQCCVNDLIWLHPECGDDPRQFLTVPMVNPLTGKPGLALAKKADSRERVYLGAHGCTIHGRAPVICQEFDCGQVWTRRNQEPWKSALANGFVAPEVMREGRRVTVIRDGRRFGGAS